MNRLCRAPAILLLIAAAVCLILGLLPLPVLRGWADSIRNADDMTPERFQRFQQVCWSFAATFSLLGILAWRQQARVNEFLLGLRDGACQWRTLFSGSVLTWLIVLVGVALRLADLNQPLAYDEAYTYISFASRSLPEAIGDYNSINNHLLNTFCVHATTQLFGPREWSIRLVPFLCGCLLIPAVIRWAREWAGERVALLAGALTAVSPGLITYSVDARGYIYILLAVILLDTSLARLHRTPCSRDWLVAWLAIVLGLCAMPIMIYGIAASVGWYLLLPAQRSLAESSVSIRQRLAGVVVLLTTAAVAVALFHTPAYIFRGLLIPQYLIMQTASEDWFLTRLAAGWRAAWDWWTDGFLAAWLWLPLLLTGLWRAERSLEFHLRWWMPFLVVLVSNVVQQVAPPPRIYLHLSPWIFLLAGVGITGMNPTQGRHRSLATWLSLAVLIAGTAVVFQRPVLFHPEDRLGYGSIPDVINRLDREIPGDQTDGHLLLAPLPCDLPSLYYMDRHGFRLKHNEQPRDGQQVWLIARHHEQPLDVLRSDLIRLGGQAEHFDDWQRVERYEFLDLYRSTWHAQPQLAESAP